jgi:hypothetical protein
MAQQPPQWARTSSLSWLHDQFRLDTPHSVGLLWTTDQPETEIPTRQHTAITRDRHPCPGGIQTHIPGKRLAADPRFRTRGHWNGQQNVYPFS